MLDLPENTWLAIFGVGIEVPSFVRTNPALLKLFYSRVVKTGLIVRKPVIKFRRPQVLPSELPKKERDLYEKLLLENDLDAQIESMQKCSRMISGRILDSLVTKFPSVHDSVYYIADGNYSSTHTENAEQVDLGKSYKMSIKEHSKTCFDPFGRGHDVIHVTKTGRKIAFSLCKLMFHRWAEKKRVYDFLSDHYAQVVQLQRTEHRAKTRVKRQKT